MFFIACNEHKKEDTVEIAETDTFNVTEDKSVENVKYSSKEIEYSPEEKIIHTGNTTPGELLSYAESLIGVPYKYGSTDPREGFDCSGFITHVFNHFNINVPRSSIDFTNVKREIPAEQAKAGDIVLFTGTDSTIRDVGHMGIITSNDNNVINFIHSTSGKANGVTITPINSYYMGRFVKVIRIFPQNN
jgi:cell wall-associated NlpC family hydrolase